MKIDTVEAIALDAKIDKPFSIATTTFSAVRSVIIRIVTNTGLVGIGESIVRDAPRATKYLVEDMLAPLIIGRDPMDAGALWWDMFSAMRVRGHTKGLFVEALSGVDVAIWDIIGKAQGVPTYKALHGFGRKTLPAYGSSVFNDTPEKMAEKAAEFVSKGYPAVKIKLGMGVQKDVAAVEAIRETVGPDIGLMVDINSRYEAATAVLLGRQLEQYQIGWIEEPVAPYDLNGYRHVKQAQPLPVAGGEGEFCLFGFRDLLATGAIDIAQPDIGRVGGFTEGMRIAALVQSENIVLQPHTGMFSALNVVVAMHFAAATPCFKIFEFMELEHPLMDIFTTPMPIPVDGVITMPDGPGLGVELAFEKIERWVVE